MEHRTQRLSRALAAITVALFVGSMFLMAGCTPFVAYEHLSQPNVNDDGYDLGCFGVEHDRGRLGLEGAICENFANSHTDTFAKINVKVRLSE